MLPFTLELRPGQSVYQQVVYAVKKAVVSGRLRPGDSFPSVRRLSQELKINPNTAHKVVAALTADGLLEVRPGIGTTVAQAPPSRSADRRALLADPLEHLVVEAKKLNLELGEVSEALAEHWQRLSETAPPRGGRGAGAPPRAEGPPDAPADSESEETP